MGRSNRRYLTVDSSLLSYKSLTAVTLRAAKSILLEYRHFA